MRTAAPSLLITLAITLIAANNVNAEIAWQQNLRAAHAQAQSEGKLLLLHFYSDNCSWCERLEKGAFQAPSVAKTIGQNFVPVKVHANSSPKLAEMFKVSKFPTDVIVTTEGKTLSHAVSPQNPNRYVAMLTSTYPALAAAKSLADSQNAAAPAAPRAPASSGPSSQIAAAPPSPTSPPSAAAASPNTAPQPGLPAMAMADDKVPGPATADLSQPTPSMPLPGYAASPSPGDAMAQQAAPPTQSQPNGLPDAALELPSGGLSGGAKAQLAGSRSEGLTLEMPEQVTAGAEPSVAKNAVEDSIVGTVTDTAAAASTPPAGPAEQPELAMQGFCPVTVINEDKWVEGKPEFGVIHLGKLYLFTSVEKMNRFLADPVPYTPVLNEIDVVRFFEERKIVPGKREWGLKDPIYNRMFFFADEAAMNHFYNEYERYTDAAIEVMAKAVKDANPGT